MSTAIFIPTFHRADRIGRVITNIVQNTPEPYRIYFIAESGDMETAREFTKLFTFNPSLVIFNKHQPCYAGAINTAYEQTTEEYFFTGADDLDFHAGWLKQALSHMKGDIEVVGTNDMGSIPVGTERDSTHYLISRKYIQNQGGCVTKEYPVLYPYDHNYTDKEFIETAKARRVFEYCPESEVEHVHWAWGKAQMDDTYRKGFESNDRDHELFIQRQHLWNAS